MAFTWRTPTTVRQDNLADSTNLNLAVPSGTADGDVVIICQHTEGDAATIPLPGGGSTFTKGGEIAGLAGSDNTGAWFYKYAGASEPTDYTISHNMAIASAIAGACLVIPASEVDAVDILDVTPTASHETYLENIAIPTADPITTVTNSAEVVIMHGMMANDVTVCGAPTGYTLRVDLPSSGNNNRGLAVATKEVVTAGLETPGAWLHTASPTNEAEGTSLTFAIRPAVVSTGIQKSSLSHSMAHSMAHSLG